MKEKLDALDVEVFKLKGGFVSALEYDSILAKKIFEAAATGDLQSFTMVVKESDIRVFKR